MTDVERTGAPVSDTVPWDLFGKVLEPGMEPGEDLTSVIRLGQVLAARRAQRHERDLMAVDVEFAFALLCWWPFKAPVEPELQHRLFKLRGDLLARIKSGGRVMEGGLLDALDGVLTLPYEEMLAKQRDGTLAGMIPEVQRGRLEASGTAPST